MRSVGVGNEQAHRRVVLQVAVLGPPGGVGEAQCSAEVVEPHGVDLDGVAGADGAEAGEDRPLQEVNSSSGIVVVTSAATELRSLSFPATCHTGLRSFLHRKSA